MPYILLLCLLLASCGHRSSENDLYLQLCEVQSCER